MLPSAVVTLDEMPLTRSGKIDYQHLPEPSPAPAVDCDAGGGSQLIGRLSSIWQDVLGAARVAPEDDFFDLGGDSLAAMRIVARIREAFDVDVDVSLILDAGTVARVAQSLGGALPPLVDARQGDCHVRSA
jgi:acyl carrier protein